MLIHQIHRRWIKPFETVPADRLLRLKHHAEAEEEASIAATAKFQTLDIRLEVEIAARPEVVWHSLAGGIGEWWPAKFYVGPSPKRFVLLSFRDTPFGLLSDMATEGLEQGRRWLLQDCLKPFLEAGTRPERP